jgi:hypothetical protein
LTFVIALIAFVLSATPPAQALGPFGTPDIQAWVAPEIPDRPDPEAPATYEIPDMPGAEAAENDDSEAPAATEYPIQFPVGGKYSYTDSWGAPRSGGRTHKGADIFAEKGTPVVAVADGTVVRIAKGARAGRYIVVEHEGGWRSYYLHLNNDTAGTDDGMSDTLVEGIAIGAAVKAGDLLDYVGDSGNAEGTSPHLHFEIHTSEGPAINPYPHLKAAEGVVVPKTSVAGVLIEPLPNFTGENVDLVGWLDPGGGFAAGITVHAATAYMGTWGRPNACPASGVRMIDVSDPTDPVELDAIASGAEFPGTNTDSVWVGAVETPAFSGDLAVVALRLCNTSDRNRLRDQVRGLALYDVTDPSFPVLLSTHSSGARTQGIHELDVVARDDGALLVAATALQSLPHTGGEAGDLRIIDITDPAAPVRLADWDLRRDAPPEVVDAMLAEVYDKLELHAHSATWSDDGTSLWVANWDAGVTLLDTADPARPEITTMFGYGPDTMGNAHSLAIDAAAGLLVVTDQDLINSEFERHEPGWGGQRLFDVSDPGTITQVGTYFTERATPNSDGGAVHVDGRYSAHNAQIVDGIEYVAWYSDGVRILDLADPTAPEELGWFIPPLRADPQGYWDAPDGTPAFAMVWGVHVADDLVYVSDMHSGLWIIRYAPPAPDPAEPTGRLKL